ncbi:MAG: UDP-3-O-(3-hydroxymyristoyl)glucosamine N-acyltransferase [Coxiella sp. RIFCSPHIGHO2_12_FULL_44_14]|nr:MAG: UDP-3-O-(3-hydroxymyristoyl)glucosamine N-acyltransferase [Coxiella sp. RIFCSPHIGHO2_12_FULL_44_14]
MRTSTYTLSELAKVIGAEVRGDEHCPIHGVAPLATAGPGEIGFLTQLKYRHALASTQASAVLLSKKFESECPVNALIMPRPELGLVKLLEMLTPTQLPAAGIHPSVISGRDCCIDPSASIGAYVVLGDRVIIGPRTVVAAGTIVGAGTHLGADCYLYSRVTLYHDITVGNRVIIHSGAVVGADGFGLACNSDNHWVKIPQIGGVVIGDDVEIGANTTIDRGALEDTVIGNGVKLDNQIMVGHNVQIGDHTAIAGCVGIAGSAKIGRYCMIGAAACINGHIEIGDHVTVTGTAMVQKSITEPGIYSSGTGIQTNQAWHKSVIRFWQLDEWAKRLKRIERRLHEQNGK